ncbi:MAG: glutamine--fructose-6-phosphate transaminase (isomerizing) [Candidatus Levybacteria bacterium]|nr:glutamine--fructose-6-phosphate transaminase (isomerizing) [Candidatus Levybacteria bacterium]
MCGIFGYVGNKNDAADIVLEGLKLLEYRGYDSWGVAVKVRKKLSVDKHIGKIGDAQVNLPQSVLGIGHTRWATHGGVTAANAHPHMDCTKTIAVVHNGIVENFQELKTELIEKGHKFISETDTEIIPHLIEENLKKEGFASSVRDAFNSLKGLNAVVVAYAPSREIVAAKTGSPLVVGIGKNELFVASDASAIVKHTKKVIFLEDNQMVILGKRLKLINLPGGKEIKPTINKINWKFEHGEKGKFKHFLLKEINDQRTTIIDAVTQNEKKLFEFANLIRNSFDTYISGCGTAGHACRMATYIFSTIAKKHINFAIGSEFSYYEDFLTDKSLLIVASQSGETIDLVEAVSAARRHKSKVTALVNVIGSTLYRQCDLVLPLRAGVERCVLSTKSFTSKLAIFYLLAFILKGEYSEGRKKIIKTARAVGELLDDKEFNQQLKNVADEIYKTKDIYILGRGFSFPLALEAAHKIKEASYIHAEGFAGGEPKHCEISLVSEGTPTIVFVPNDETKSAIISNATEFKARGAYIIGIGPEKQAVFDEWIQVPDLGVTSSIINIIPAQLLAYYLALKKGNDPDKPRNLAKSVTVK